MVDTYVHVKYITQLLTTPKKVKSLIRRPDTIPDSLYTALVESRSKALLFCYTTCVVKQLYKLKSDLAVADEQRLASARRRRGT